jgi:recombination protein RecA
MDSFVDRIYEEVGKDFGEGVMISGQDALRTQAQVIPWTPSLDIITCGGIEEGSCVGITGNPKTGKTSAALSFCANAQKPEYGSRPIYYAKIEGRLSLKHLQAIQGLSLERGKFNIIQSVEGRILSAQDYLSILEKIIKTVPGAVVILDSISALCDEKEQNEGVGTETRGGGAKIFSQWCRLLNQVVPVNRTIVLGITHLISNTSGMGAQYVERAARMWLYQKDYDLRTTMKSAWKAGNDQVGFIIKWVCNTSKNGQPGMTIDSYLRFGIGFDRLYEIQVLGMAGGLIRKTGSWLQLSYLTREPYRHLLETPEAPKFQGGEKLYEALLKYPQWANALEREVMTLAGGLAGVSE